MLKKRLVIIMNENHTLLPEQERILKEQFDLEPEFLFAPVDGWTKEEINKVAASFKEVAIGNDRYHYQYIVLVSPIPYLLRELTRGELIAYPECSVETGILVYVFHNDRREKKELPDGRIIQVVAQDGWQLV